jgi:hypothetical protein
MTDLNVQFIFLARALLYYDVAEVSRPVHAWDIAKQINIDKPGYIDASSLNEALKLKKIRCELIHKGFIFERMFQQVEISSGCTELIRGWKVSFPLLSANLFHTEWVHLGKMYYCSK